MKNVITANQEQILKLASDSNFWGKRKRDTRLAVCDTIVSAIGQRQDQLESGTLCDWLLENKPQPKAAPKTRASNKLDADAMLGEQQKKRATLDILEGDCFIITTAQNNTAVSPVFDQLKTLAENLQGQLIVLPTYYNKNAFSPAVDDRSNFAKEVKPYLLENDLWIGEQDAVRLMPSANVLPTAKYPMNAAGQLNAGELATIVPATKQQMQTLPRLPSQPIKEAWATGCCTVYNYIECRAGSEAETEHVFGGLLVTRTSNGKYQITNLRQGDDGSLMFELNGYVTDEYLTEYSTSSDVVLGDLHCEMQDKNIYNLTLNWLGELCPNRVAVHDILHFATRSHHNRHSGKHMLKMFVDGNTVQNDLTRVIEQLNDIAEVCNTVYVVESNHNSALDNWLDDSKYNPMQDPENAKLYYLLNFAMCEAIEQGIDKNALEIALLECTEKGNLPELADNVRFGAMDKVEDWHGIDVSQHGHKGQNGSMGNPNLFNKWRLKLVTGHTHSPRITGDVVTVGVMARLNQGYNKGGASSWNHANAVILPNGTAQLVKVLPLTK